MQKINVDKQVVIAWALLTFLAAELFIFLPWGVKKIATLNSRISMLSREIENAERQWPQKDNLASRNEEIKKEIEALRAKFILPEEETKLLSFISSHSKDFGVEIQSLTPGKIEPVPGAAPSFKYLPIAIKAKGGFHDTAKFLQYLQGSQYFFEVKELKILSDYPQNSVELVLCGMIKEK